jgi:hypothetical protein
MTRQPLARLLYWLVIVVLAAGVVGSVLLVAAYGWSAPGALGIVGGLVCAALLLSYAGSMHPGRHTTPGR